MLEGRAMDCADTLNAIMDNYRYEVVGDELDSTSVTRLMELGVIRGVARNESYAGSRLFI